MKIKNFIVGMAVIAACTFTLSGCGGSKSSESEKMTEQAKSVSSMINELPEEYSADAVDAIIAARTAYDALSDEEKDTVDDSALSVLEQAKNQEDADAINKEIDEITVKNGNYYDLNTSKKSVSGVMDEIANLSPEVDKLINYDSLLKKIDDISSEYTDTILDADNDLNAMNDIMTKLNSINNSYSSASKYGYACDIYNDVSKLSTNLSSIKNKLLAPANDLKDTCLYGEDFDITLAVLDIVKEIPENSTEHYDPYLNDTEFVDDCLKWQQIVQEKIEENKAESSSEPETD